MSDYVVVMINAPKHLDFVSIQIENTTNISEWQRICSKWPRVPLTQFPAYGHAKAITGQWQPEHLVFIQDQKPVAACLALLRIMRIPCSQFGLAWINRGPIVAPNTDNDTNIVSGCLQALFERYTQQHNLYLRIAPITCNDHELPTPFQKTNQTGWHSALLDLEKSPEDLRTALKQKWRNALNKAERANIDIHHGNEIAMIKEFALAHDAFSKSVGFKSSVNGAFIEALATSFDNSKAMTVFVAKDTMGEIQGRALISTYGNTSEYLAGNSTDAGRKTGVGQLLLWQAILQMKLRGVKWFDVGGMDPILTPRGIYKFKEGLAGEPYALPNEIEAMPTNPIANIVARVVRHRVQCAFAGR